MMDPIMSKKKLYEHVASKNVEEQCTSILDPTMSKDTGPTSWIPFEQGLNKVTKKIQRIAL